MKSICQLLIQEVDMCISFTPPTNEKIETMDISYYVIEDDIGIVIPYPNIQTNGIKALLEPFPTAVIAILYSTDKVYTSLFNDANQGLDLRRMFGRFHSGRHLDHGRSESHRRKSLLRKIFDGLLLSLP